jgi:hypothetical protein
VTDALIFVAVWVGASFGLGFVLTMMGHAAPRAAARPHRPPPPPKSRATVGRDGGWQKPVSPPLSAARPRPPDRLTETTRAWLADDRPAWETVEAFERDVAKALAPPPT